MLLIALISILGLVKLINIIHAKSKTFTPCAVVCEDELHILETITGIDVLSKTYAGMHGGYPSYQITISMQDKDKFKLAMSDPYTCEIDGKGQFVRDKENNKVYLARLR